MPVTLLQNLNKNDHHVVPTTLAAAVPAAASGPDVTDARRPLGDAQNGRHAAPEALHAGHQAGQHHDPWSTARSNAARSPRGRSQLLLPPAARVR